MIKSWYREYYTHRFITITNTDKTIDVVFSGFRGFSFTITLRQKPKGVQRRQRWITRQRESMRCLRGTPLGLCLRVNVNKKTLNLEKTTSSFLSVLLLIHILFQIISKIHTYKIFEKFQFSPENSNLEPCMIQFDGNTLYKNVVLWNLAIPWLKSPFW